MYVVAFFSRSVVSSQMYITTVCVGSCLAGKGCGAPKLGWVSVCLSAGRVLVVACWGGVRLLWLAGV